MVPNSSSQLFYDGHQSLGTSLTSAVQAEPACAPSDRLFHIVMAGLEHEPDRKDRPPNVGIGSNNIGPGLGNLHAFMVYFTQQLSYRLGI